MNDHRCREFMQMNEPRPVPTNPTKDAEPLRVMIVADSKIVGERVHQVLDRPRDIEITHQVKDGIAAVSMLRRDVVDAIVLDIGQPEQNVRVNIARMLRVDPMAKIVMVASLSFSNVKTSMTGLMEGAAEFIPTPAAHTKTTSEAEFSSQLLSVIRAFGRSGRAMDDSSGIVRSRLPKTDTPPEAQKPIQTKAPSTTRPLVLAIGSSTGGPQALHTFLATLPANTRLPIMITQHMPATFTSVLAEHISKHTNLDCREGVDGEPIQPGRVYVAPGDNHMLAEKVGGRPMIRLNQDPPVNFCRPAVDPMLNSLCNVFGGDILAVILTGMGSDGLNGCKAVAAAGGTVVAQNQETSVVWGMPRAVSDAGICSAVLPIDELGDYCGKLIVPA